MAATNQIAYEYKYTCVQSQSLLTQTILHQTCDKLITIFKNKMSSICDRNIDIFFTKASIAATSCINAK